MKHTKTFEQFINEGALPPDDFINWYNEQNITTRTKILTASRLSSADIRQYKLGSKSITELDIAGWGTSNFKKVAIDLGLYESKFNESAVNEAKAPAEALALAKALGGKATHNPQYDPDGVWSIETRQNKNGLQINYNTSKEWGPIGYQIADDEGNELYIGTDLNAAVKAVQTGK